MRVLCDRHHADLLRSLQYLFEGRFGMELFVTVGYEWWSEGYWRFGEVFKDDRLAQQYLIPEGHGWREIESGLYLTFDPCHPERPIYGCTPEWAIDRPWDFVLASVQENQKGFHRFALETGAKYLYHVGNTRQWVDYSLDPVILDGPQEFDHWGTFRFREPERMDRVVAFVNLLNKIPEQWETFTKLSELLPYEFRSFGHECPDGFLTPVAAVAEEMSRAGWAFQDKPTGDGFGHIIHNWAAVGRPLVGHASFYVGQRAEMFWRDGETCIDLDKHSLEEAAEIILSSRHEDHRRMCRTIRDVLNEHYNPAMETDRVLRLILPEEKYLTFGASHGIMHSE